MIGCRQSNYDLRMSLRYKVREVISMLNGGGKVVFDIESSVLDF